MYVIPTFLKRWLVTVSIYKMYSNYNHRSNKVSISLQTLPKLLNYLLTICVLGITTYHILQWWNWIWFTVLNVLAHSSTHECVFLFRINSWTTFHVVIDSVEYLPQKKNCIYPQAIKTSYLRILILLCQFLLPGKFRIPYTNISDIFF